MLMRNTAWQTAGSTFFSKTLSFSTLIFLTYLNDFVPKLCFELKFESLSFPLRLLIKERLVMDVDVDLL